MKILSIQTILGNPQEENSHLSWPWELQLSLTTGVGWQGRWRVFLDLNLRHSLLELHLLLESSDLLILTLYLLSLAYAAYFLAACILDFQRALALFILTCLALLVLVHCFLKRFFGKNLTSCLKPFKNSCLKLWMKWWVRQKSQYPWSRNLSKTLAHFPFSCLTVPELSLRLSLILFKTKAQRVNSQWASEHWTSIQFLVASHLNIAKGQEMLSYREEFHSIYCQGSWWK